MTTAPHDDDRHKIIPERNDYDYDYKYRNEMRENETCCLVVYAYLERNRFYLCISLGPQSTAIARW